uniref:Chitin-binding type-2 domain-containing protein n=1 Tax=Glossina austeni TaxID=7395 RepID=A0A1A9VN25_GLOAU
MKLDSISSDFNCILFDFENNSSVLFYQIDGYIAGVDYPAYEAVPKGLSFKCQGRLPGYYADIETRCQVWHWCLHSGHQYSFLCPNGTVFNQAVRVCDWWSNVNCPGSEQLYENNDELYQATEPHAGSNI